ncbi:MAG: lipid-A-disaccharide synthase [bacterium]|nr:lipid-A-disaccharide synthase [bacterium]
MNICFLVGDVSGDLHCEVILRELKLLYPNLVCWGMVGKRMASAGCEVVVPTEEMSIMGFLEVVKHYPTIHKNFQILKTAVLSRKPKVIVYVDYPSFNLQFAKWVKSQDSLSTIKNLGFISPQVWAWKEKRIYQIARYYDGLAVVFPFELRYYSKTHLDVRFVGHPLLEELPLDLTQEEARKQLGIPHSSTVVSFLPGSRVQELMYHTKLMCDSFQMLRERYPNLIGIVPALSSLPKEVYHPFVEVGFQVFYDKPNEVLRSANAAVVVSGTATLQTALLGIPMVVVYKTSPLTYFIGKRLVKVKSISLANLVMEQPIAPERIQHDANPQQICQDVIELLGENGDQQLKQFQMLREKLGNGSASKNVAQWIYELIQQNDD